MQLKEGNIAPNFSLRNTKKELIELSDFRDKSNVLLLFFPLAFTGVCTEELCSVRDDMNIYNDLGAEVLGISVDSLFVLEKYKQEQEYQFTLLSDFNKDVSRAYHTLYEEFVLGMKGVSKRSAFIVDKEGIIQYTEVLEDAGKVPDFIKIKNTLAKLNG